MFKKTDYIIISIICLFLGIFLVSQFYSAGEYKKVTQPENNEVLAVEVAKLTRSNADLRREVQDLTFDLNSYMNATDSRKKSYEKYLNDTQRYDVINGVLGYSGQGVIISINGKLITPQLVDLINAIKNIGGETIEINGERVIVDTDFSVFNNRDFYTIKVLGNSKLLKSAMERKGGIVDQIATKDVSFQIEELDNLTIGPSANVIKFNYSKILE